MLYTMLGCSSSHERRDPCRYVLIQGSAFVVDKMPKPPDRDFQRFKRKL